MIEINIRDSLLFKQVALEIGEDKAYSELLEVVLKKLNRGERDTSFLTSDLVYAFDWSNSPQGREFWSRIHTKVERKR